MVATAGRRKQRWIAASLCSFVLVGMTACSSRTHSSAKSQASTSGAASSVNTAAQVQTLVDAYLSKTKTPGIAVAIVGAGSNPSTPQITYVTRGVANLESKQPVTTRTQFEMASETKAFTAGLLSYLVATKRVTLDDPVQKYAPAGVTVPSWTENGVTTPITLRDLATHQSGLPDTAGNIDAGCSRNHPDCNQDEKFYTVDLLWRGVEKTKLTWKPGTNWLYSNFGFGLLGTILTGVMFPGQNPPPYEAALETAFLQPLSMTSTQLEHRTPELATPYDDKGKPTWYLNDTDALAGEAGLISDIADMGTWIGATLGLFPPGAQSSSASYLPSTLNPISTITQNCQSAKKCSADNFQMGMAWQLYSGQNSNVGVPWAAKNGATAGYESTTYLAPSRKVGVTILANRSDGRLDDLGTQIFKLVLGAN